MEYWNIGCFLNRIEKQLFVEFQKNLKPLPRKNKLSRLWERLPAAKLNDRGWKPLPLVFFYGNLNFLDKHHV